MRVLLLLTALLAAQAAPPPPAGAELIAAIKLGDTARARALATGGAALDTLDWRGYTPLIWAAAAGNADVVSLLVERGARVEARAKDGTTALIVAAGNGSSGIVRLLLSRGADPFAMRQGATARQLAVARGFTEAAKLLEAAEALGTRLLAAAAAGQSGTVRQLLAEGAPANATNTEGASALMLAAGSGDLTTVQALLSRGAETGARDRQGLGVLDWAGRSASGSQVAAYLRERGVTGAAPAAAASPAPQVRASLEAIDGLLAKAAPASAAGRAAHARAASVLAQLRTLAAAWPAESPDDYRANLAGDVRTLSGAIAGADEDRLRQALDAIADDLEAKLEHCRMSGGRLGGSVRVRVRTVQAGQEAGQWQVFYMPRIFEVSPTAVPDLFPQLSSPTEEPIVPGRYLMWVRNPATGKVGERTVVKVGEGRKELIVDLPVPVDGR
jgi:hypothetical protein